MDATQILEFIKSFFSPLINFLKWIYEKSPLEIRRRKQLHKLGLIEDSWRNHTWAYGNHENEKVVLLDTHWQITNTLPYNLTTLNAFLKKPRYAKGSVMMKDVTSQYWGHYPIPKGYTTEMGITFAINNKYIKDAKSILKVKIELQDPTGRTHRVDSVLIYPARSNKPKKIDNLKVEDSSKIKNSIEKQVVAVLKNETQQYKARGRREGRLGTVEWPRGTIEWREADSKIQFLFGSSIKTNVSSEHVNALLKLYGQSSTEHKELIIKSLLNRIDKKREYRDVGYLIVFCLFEMDQLKKALDMTLQKLKGDKSNGFSDVLRIIDILLAFRFEEFQEAELKAIEEFVYSTKENPFSIKERINAIRVKGMTS